MSLGKDLKKFRTERHIKRKDAAEALNIPYSTLTDYENDQIDIPYSKLKKLFDFYQIGLEAYLITSEEYINIKNLSDVSKDKIFTAIREDPLKYKK